MVGCPEMLLVPAGSRENQLLPQWARQSVAPWETQRSETCQSDEWLPIWCVNCHWLLAEREEYKCSELRPRWQLPVFHQDEESHPSWGTVPHYVWRPNQHGESKTGWVVAAPWLLQDLWIKRFQAIRRSKVTSGNRPRSYQRPKNFDPWRGHVSLGRTKSRDCVAGTGPSDGRPNIYCDCSSHVNDSKMQQNRRGPQR